MAGGQGIRAGRAFVEIFADDSKLRRGLDSAQKKLRAFGKTVSTIGASLAGIGGAGLFAFAPTVKAAADAQEALSKFEAVFGDQTAAASEFADTLANNVGRSALNIKNSMSSFQGFFKGLGFGNDEALQMSETLQKLSIDFASFNNMSDEEAAQRFISALSGSSEVLSMFGINTKVAALEQELLSQGIKTAWNDVDEQTKSIARLNVIIKSMTTQGAVGDAVRTADSFANQLKRTNDAILDMKVAIGRAIIPVLTPFLKLAGHLVEVFTEFVTRNPRVVAAVFVTTAAIAALGAALVAVGAAFMLLGGPLTITFGVLAGLATSAAVAFGLMADSWNMSLEGMIGAATSFAKSTISVFAAMATQIAEILAVVGIGDAMVSRLLIHGFETGALAAIDTQRQRAIDAIGAFDLSGGSGAALKKAKTAKRSNFGSFSGDARQFSGGQPSQAILDQLKKLNEQVGSLSRHLDEGLAFS